MTSAEEFTEGDPSSKEDSLDCERSVSPWRPSFFSTTQRLSAVEIHKLRNLTRKSLPITDEEDTPEVKKYPSANLSTVHRSLDSAQLPVKASIGKPLQFVASQQQQPSPSTGLPSPSRATVTTPPIITGETIQSEVEGEPGEQRTVKKQKWRQLVRRYQQQSSILVVNEPPLRSKSLIPLESRVHCTTPKELPSPDNTHTMKDRFARRPFLETNNELFASAPRTSVADEQQQTQQHTRLHPLFQLCKLQVWRTTKTPPKPQSSYKIPSVIEYNKEPTAADIYGNNDDGVDSLASIPCPIEISVGQSDVRQAERKPTIGLSYCVNEILYPMVLAIVLYRAILYWNDVAEESTGTVSKAVVLSEQYHSIPANQSKAIVAAESVESFSSRDAILTPNYLQMISSTRKIPLLEWIGYEESDLVHATCFELLPSPPLLLPGHVGADAQEDRIPIDPITSGYGYPSFEWNVEDRAHTAPGNVRKLEKVLNNVCFACDDSGPNQPLVFLSKVLMLNGKHPWSHAWDGL